MLDGFSKKQKKLSTSITIYTWYDSVNYFYLFVQLTH